MRRFIRTTRPGTADYAGLALFLCVWLATIALIALPGTSLLNDIVSTAQSR